MASKLHYWLKSSAILLKGWVLSIGGASAVEGLLSTGPTPSSFDIYEQKNVG